MARQGPWEERRMTAGAESLCRRNTRGQLVLCVQHQDVRTFAAAVRVCCAVMR